MSSLEECQGCQQTINLIKFLINEPEVEFDFERLEREGLCCPTNEGHRIRVTEEEIRRSVLS